jgi:cytoskeletal protein CcmA (bactofilin family)
MARHDPEISVIGAGTRLTGRVSGQGALRIEGSVKGDVQVSGETEIAENASVEGNLQADTLDVTGTLIGDATAKGPIAVRAGALVRGELRASEVSIEPGSRVSVRLDTQVELDLALKKR